MGRRQHDHILTRIEITIERLNEKVDLLKYQQLIHALRNSCNKIEAGVSTVNKLVFAFFYDVAEYENNYRMGVASQRPPLYRAEERKRAESDRAEEANG